MNNILGEFALVNNPEKARQSYIEAESNRKSFFHGLKRDLNPDPTVLIFRTSEKNRLPIPCCTKGDWDCPLTR